jgi:peptidyl-tRNA hydrolase, PTH1 family
MLAGWRRLAGHRAAAPAGQARDEPTMADERWLVIGLGNPGPQYAGNRHNVGYMCCDALAAAIGTNLKRDRSRAMTGTGTFAGVRVIVAKPVSFMNASGGPAAALRAFYKIPVDRIVVIHDELDLAFGTIRLKLGGGDNGHNGLRSITSAFRTRDYYRLRIGIGRPPGRMDPADYVLRDFAAPERAELPELLGRSGDALEVLLTRGLTAAQNDFH